MTTVRIRSPFLAQLYREAYARHQEALRLGLQEMHKTDMFPPPVPRVLRANVKRPHLSAERFGNAMPNALSLAFDLAILRSREALAVAEEIEGAQANAEALKVELARLGSQTRHLRDVFAKEKLAFAEERLRWKAGSDREYVDRQRAEEDLATRLASAKAELIATQNKMMREEWILKQHPPDYRAVLSRKAPLDIAKQFTTDHLTFHAKGKQSIGGLFPSRAMVAVEWGVLRTGTGATDCRYALQLLRQGKDWW